MEFSSTRLVGTKRNETKIFIFYISHPFPTYFGLKWTIMVFLLFFQFLTIFMEFSIMFQIGTKWNDNFYFLTFPAISNLFWLIMRPHWYFLIFWIFFVIFLEFSITHRVETKQNDNFLFSLYLFLFQPIMAWNESIMVFFNFLNFFLLFLNFLLHVGTE